MRAHRNDSNRAAGVVLLLAGLCLAGCAGRDAASKAEEAGREEASRTVLVGGGDVVRAETRHLEAGVSFSGELAPQEITEVVARFAGDLRNVRVREGQAVRRGQSLAVYDPMDVNDALKAAEAELLAAKAGLLAAQNAERRARKLLEAGAAASSDLEAAEAGRAAAEARVSAAEAAVNHAREDSEKLDVPAPIAGRVSHIVVHNGSRTAVGDPLFTLVNIDTLELSATLPSEVMGRIAVGTPIRFHVDAYPGEVFEGKVDRISPTTEPGTRQIKVYTRVPNPGGRLTGGLFASGRVVTSMKDRALAVPVTALRREGDGQVVYRLSRGRAERIPVTTGLVDEDAGVVELDGPLAPGDSLLTGVLPGIKDGVPVRVLAGSGQSGTAGGSGSSRVGGATPAGTKP